MIWAALVVSSLGALVVAWSLLEPRRCRVNRADITVPNLPAAFDGFTIAFLADTHHGPFVPLSYLRRVVEMANALDPDLVALGGDYVQRRPKRSFGPSREPFIRPGVAVLGALKAKEGCFAVLGNHDIRTNRDLTSRALAEAGLRELTNAGVWLRRGKARLRFCGLDDPKFGNPDLAAALGDATPDDPVVLLCHNPDYVEKLRDPRVGLVLSGHTHGGQVVLPLVGAPIVPSKYGQKYRRGLVQGPVAQVFVTCGVGVVMPPVRLGCAPEIALLTLRCCAGAPLDGGTA